MRTANPLDRARAAFEKAVSRAEVQNRQHAIVGWRKSETEVRIAVPGRANYIYVTKGSDQTVTVALNRANVPRQAFLPVWLVLENNTYVVVGRDNSNAAALANVPDSAYGVPAHPHALSGLSDVLLTSPADGERLAWDNAAGKWVNVTKYVHPNHTGDVTSAGDGATTIANDAVTNAKAANMPANTIKANVTGSTADPSDVNATTLIGQYIHGASAKTTPVDADTMPLIDSAASNVLKKVTWANIKATLKTYFDTLYTAINTAVLLTGNQSVAGVKTFSNGIAFGNETLANYDEGTWSPAITGSTTDPTVTYTTQSGDYTRIGNVIFYRFQVTINTISGGSGEARISVPVTNGSVTTVGVAMTSGVDLPGTPAGMSFTVVASQAFGVLQAMQDNGGVNQVQVSGLAAGDTIRGAGFYMV